MRLGCGEMKTIHPENPGGSFAQPPFGIYEKRERSKIEARAQAIPASSRRPSRSLKSVAPTSTSIRIVADP